MDISRTHQVLSAVCRQPVSSETVTELLQEHFRIRLCSEVLPSVWKKIADHNKEPESCVEQFCCAVRELQTGWDELLTTTPGVREVQSEQRASLRRVLHTSLAVTHPPSLHTAVVNLCQHSIRIWNKRCNDVDVSMDTDNPGNFWSQFTLVVSVMRELGVLSFFMEHSVGSVVRDEVVGVVREECLGEFESPLIEELVSSVQERITNWVAQIYGGEEDKTYWMPHVEYLTYKSFGELRISELFDILVDFPDSEAALHDLRACLGKVNLRTSLIASLKTAFEQRLLHPGVDTADIITQYVSAIKGLRILDPSGVVLEQVCDPVRRYLRTRDNTVRTIVASLIDDSEIADELVVGEPVLVDLNEESDGEEGDYESWQPDPIDADPTKTSRSRQTSDIISLLVNIYGSREMFVNEYRNLLADRLLQNTGYNTSREVRNLELLKLRFGESNLHFCEVMVKDIADSKRINAYVHTKLQQEKEAGHEAEAVSGTGFNAFILSHVFWPTFREEKLKIPDFAQKQLEKYCELYKGLKGMRTLEWKSHLGLVDVELQLEDRQLTLCVSPFRASIIYRFGEKSKWTVDALSIALEAQPSAVRRHLGFWVSQGVLREKPTDTFTVIERQQKGTAASSQDMEDDDESATVSAEDQRENEFQVYWAYIVGMLKSLGKMNIDKIHSTLRMFAMQGDGSQECSQTQLKLFLERKVRDQELCVSAGLYHLP